MIHIAVLLKPYLDLIIQGRKTVECRLTQQARDPYERIEPGERIYFKQSAGPYGATAVVEHVMFESDLSPARVKQIRSDYNDMICGDAAFWNDKRNSRYCTLIWLKDVQATSTGPAIRRLQGVAWLSLEEDPVWRRVDQSSPKPAAVSSQPNAHRHTPFLVQVTAGNLRNNSLYLTSALDRFPTWSLGGKNKSQAARPITLMLHEGPTVKSDIVATRNMLRTRVWGAWFRKHGVKEGDSVVFTPLDEENFFVGLARNHKR